MSLNRRETHGRGRQAIAAAAVSSGLNIARRLIQQEWTQRRAWYTFNYRNSNLNSLRRAAREATQAHNRRLNDIASTSSAHTSEHETPSERSSSQVQESNRESPSYSPVESDQEMQDATNNMDTNNGDVQADSAANAVGSGGGKSSGSSVRGEAFLPPGLPIIPQENVVTYTKNYRFRIQNRKIDYRTSTAATPSTSANSFVIVRFPYYDLPTQRLGFYLSEEEIDKITTECTSAEVLEVEVEIYNHIANLPFETASSTTTLANNNVGISLCLIDPSINKYRLGMIPNIGAFIEERCWGTHASALPLSTSFTSNNIGQLSAETVTKDLDLRFEYTCTTGERSSFTATTNNVFNYKQHVFPINQFIAKQINASFNEGLFHVHSYKPKNGQFFKNNGMFGTSLDVNSNTPVSANLKYGQFSRPYTQMMQQAGSGVNLDRAANPYGRTLGDNTTNNILFFGPQGDIPRANYSMLEIDQTNGADVPACCFGIYPKITGQFTDVNYGDLVQAQIEIEVKVLCRVKETRSNNFMFRKGGNTQIPNHTLPWVEKVVTPANLIYDKRQNTSRLLSNLNSWSQFASQPWPEPGVPIFEKIGPERAKLTNKSIDEYNEKIDDAKDFDEKVHEKKNAYLQTHTAQETTEGRKLRNGKVYHSYAHYAKKKKVDEDKGIKVSSFN